jgi:hypothetical protein
VKKSINGFGEDFVFDAVRLSLELLNRHQDESEYRASAASWCKEALSVLEEVGGQHAETNSEPGRPVA